MDLNFVAKLDPALEREEDPGHLMCFPLGDSIFNHGIALALRA